MIAAERLRSLLLNQGAKDGVSDALSPLLNEALAAAKAEGAREAVEWIQIHVVAVLRGAEARDETAPLHPLLAILDEEAAR